MSTNQELTLTEIVRKAAMCIYAEVSSEVATEVSGIMREAADKIDELELENKELKRAVRQLAG